MCNTWYINPCPKSSRSHNIQAFTTEPSLETDFSLSKEVNIIVLGIPIIIVVFQLPSKYFALGITSVVDYALLSRYQTPKPNIDQFLGLYWPSFIIDLQYRILGLDIVTRYTDIEGILQLYNLFKLLLVEQRQGPSKVFFIVVNQIASFYYIVRNWVQLFYRTIYRVYKIN